MRLKLWGFSVCEALMRDSRARFMAAGSCTTAASLILTLPLAPAYARRAVQQRPRIIRCVQCAAKSLQMRSVLSTAELAALCTH